MASFVAVVAGLSLVFAALILAIGAELYYLLWWKKPLTAREIDEANTNYVQELLYMLSSRQRVASPLQLTTSHQSHSTSRAIINSHDSDLEMGSSRSLLKPSCEESVESELIRLHNLAGPPRFLFTIKEETREDLDSEDARSRGDRSRKGSRTRSLSDVVVTPFMTPIASPRISSPVLSHQVLESYSHHGINPLYETATSVEETELNRLRQSPPPKFKFLRDAEEKLYRRLKEQVMKNGLSAQTCKLGTINNSSTTRQEDQIGTLITLISGGKKDNDSSHHHHFVHQPLNSSSSKVLPLSSSPTGVRVQAT